MRGGQDADQLDLPGKHQGIGLFRSFSVSSTLKGFCCWSVAGAVDPVWAPIHPPTKKNRKRKAPSPKTAAGARNLFGGSDLGH